MRLLQVKNIIEGYKKTIISDENILSKGNFLYIRNYELIRLLNLKNAPVAQLDRASDYGSEG